MKSRRKSIHRWCAAIFPSRSTPLDYEASEATKDMKIEILENDGKRCAIVTSPLRDCPRRFFFLQKMYCGKSKSWSTSNFHSRILTSHLKSSPKNQLKLTLFGKKKPRSPARDVPIPFSDEEDSPMAIVLRGTTHVQSHQRNTRLALVGSRTTSTKSSSSLSTCLE